MENEEWHFVVVENKLHFSRYDYSATVIGKLVVKARFTIRKIHLRYGFVFKMDLIDWRITSLSR